VVDAAIFAIARCAGPQTYFDVIDAAFARAEAIAETSQKPTGALAVLEDLAGAFGIRGERFAACINSPETFEHLAAVRAEAIARGVTGTPTFFINDRKLALADASTASRFFVIIAAALRDAHAESKAAQTK
jgi:protein-disulfide isomerase